MLIAHLFDHTHTGSSKGVRHRAYLPRRSGQLHLRGRLPPRYVSRPTGHCSGYDGGCRERELRVSAIIARREIDLSSLADVLMFVCVR